MRREVNVLALALRASNTRSLAASAADAYPNRPVHMIVGFAPAVEPTSWPASSRPSWWKRGASRS